MVMNRIFIYFSLALLLADGPKLLVHPRLCSSCHCLQPLRAANFASEQSEETCSLPDRDEQLQEVVILGRQKSKKLLGRGTRLLGAVVVLTPDRTGHEIGSAVTVNHTTEVKEITFDILANSIKGAVLGMSIYRDSTFTPLPVPPVLVEIPQGKRQTMTIVPDRPLLLEPGNYIFAVSFVGCHEEVKAQWAASTRWDDKQRYGMMKQDCIQFPLYTKESYIRDGTTDTFGKRNFNIGLRVRGVEHE